MAKMRDRGCSLLVPGQRSPRPVRRPFARKQMTRFLLPLLTALLFLPSAAKADSESEWALILKLDQGPQKKPASLADVRVQAHDHLVLQQKTLETFLSRYPADPRVFEAQMKLAAVQAALGNLDENHSMVEAAIKSLAALENSPRPRPNKRPTRAFSRHPSRCRTRAAPMPSAGTL